RSGMAAAIRRAISTDILHSPARVPVIQAAEGLLSGSDSDPGQGSVRLLVRRAVPVLRESPRDARARRVRSERRSALHGHAAASTDGHFSYDADRLASTRVRRAAAARDVRSAGTASPVPKYI